MNRLHQQLQFAIEIDKVKHIVRRNYLSDSSRRENDAEHSWHLASMVVLLQEYASVPNIDLLKAVKMALVHDLVEIYAGDIIVYSRQEIADQEAREQAAADKLFSMLPEDQAIEYRAAWDEFTASASAESRYVKALDRLQPLMLNCASKGKCWKENGVTAEMALNLNLPIIEAGAPGLLDYTRNLLLNAQEQGLFHTGHSNSGSIK